LPKAWNINSPIMYALLFLNTRKDEGLSPISYSWPKMATCKHAASGFREEPAVAKYRPESFPATSTWILRRESGRGLVEIRRSGYIRYRSGGQFASHAFIRLFARQWSPYFPGSARALAGRGIHRTPPALAQV
jgi:hypothetical protein